MRTTREILDLIGDRDKRWDIAQAMMDAAFEALADMFPEVTSGDFPPDADWEVKSALADGAKIWVEGNLPYEEVEENG